MCMSLSVCREMYVCRYFKSACLYVSNFYFCISQSVCPRGLYPIVYVMYVSNVCVLCMSVYSRAPHWCTMYICISELGQLLQSYFATYRQFTITKATEECGICIKPM